MEYASLVLLICYMRCAKFITHKLIGGFGQQAFLSLRQTRGHAILRNFSVSAHELGVLTSANPKIHLTMYDYMFIL